MNHLLLVDDEPNVISSLKRTLIDEDIEIFSANSGPEALELMEANAIHVVISDERMPGMTGGELLAEIKLRHPFTVRMMLTGHASLEGAMKAVNSGEIYRFFMKPWDDNELKIAIRNAFEKYHLEEQNRILLRTVEQQATDLKMLEKKYPGISEIERDDSGSYVMPDITDEERNRIINGV